MKLTILYILLFCDVFVRAQARNDREENELFGPVSKAFSHTYKVEKRGDALIKLYLVDADSLIFNEDGNYQEVYRFDQGEQAIGFKHSYHYDSLGRLNYVEVTNKYRSSLAIHEMVNNADGLVKEENIMVDEKYAQFKGRSTRYVYTYDSIRRKIRMDCFNYKTGGNLSFTETYFYNDKSDLTKVVTEGENLQSTKKYDYEYAAEGWIKKLYTTYIDKEGKETTFTSLYVLNEKGKRTEEHYNEINHPIYNGSLYELDMYGNKVKETHYEGGEARYLTERSLEYFPME